MTDIIEALAQDANWEKWVAANSSSETKSGCVCTVGW